jgi:transcriptional regulator with XRE-family HTH domain
VRCSPTAVLATTGIRELDDVLGGLYWGDNVVWELDGAPVAPFYRAVADGHQFDSMLVVTLGRAVNTYGIPGLTVVDRQRPAELLAELHRRCRPRARRLLLFTPMETMIAAWGPTSAREFFARCCPMLLELGAIAYWSLDAHGEPATVRKTVEAVTQCVLRVDARTVRVVKAEGHTDAAAGAVLAWHEEDGLPVLSSPELIGRVAGSLRELRRSHSLSQHELGDLAGVTASAISQAERAERGLSLATLVRLSEAFGVTIDDLLHGGGQASYRIGRRGDGPGDVFEHTLTPLADSPDLQVALVRLGARESSVPATTRHGRAIVAVAGGLVQVVVGERTPTLRHGEVLVTDSAQVQAWRNLGQAEASLFWIVAPTGA